MKFGFFTKQKSGGASRSSRGGGRSLGQSLVELGLTMPVLLLIVAGTVEVTNMLTLYNELQLAVREGARVAAQGAPDNTVMDTISDSLSRTAVVSDTDELTVWVVRPVLDIYNCPGSCAWRWSSGPGVGSTTAWGIGESCVSIATSCDEGITNPVTPDMVGGALWKVPNSSLSGEKFAIVSAKYNVQTLLNLRFWGTANGRLPVYAYTVLRQEVSAQTAAQLASGCSAYPIAISSDTLPPEPQEGDDFPNPISLNSFPGSRNSFGFVSWRANTVPSPNEENGTALNLSLPTPGNSQPNIPAANTHSYLNPYSTGNQLRRGVWVLANSGTLTTTVQNMLNAHRSTGRALRVLLYTYDAPQPTVEHPTVGTQNPALDATKWYYQISDFVVVKVESVTSTQVQFSFVKLDTSCGYPQ